MAHYTPSHSCDKYTISISMKMLFTIALWLSVPVHLVAQGITGYVIDRETKEPLVGATVILRANGLGMVTDHHGYFAFSTAVQPDTLEVTYIGYDKQIMVNPASNSVMAMSPSSSNLQQVVITANREAALRTEAPVAISKLSPTAIHDTKPVLLTELINQVPGVVMLNYNNEQHAMSIRQPMATSPYFLYLEDGLPIRPMGVFNHNALIEMNIFGVSSIEVVKGPASSLYGPEAVGGAINFITHRAAPMPTAKVGLQANEWGYKRVQYAAGGTVAKKLGIYVSGFEGRQRNAWQTNSDYDKSSISVRLDYTPSEKTTLTATFAGNEYNAAMAGSVDSAAYYTRAYTSSTDFTYRKVHSQRTRLTATHQWNAANRTSLTLAYRDNYIEQVPNYGIRWAAGSSTASVERNRNTFYSHVALLHHHLAFNFLNARLLVGGMADRSPVNYWAYGIDLAAQLRADKSSVEKYTIIAERPDLAIADYEADLKNYAAYAQFEINPIERLKVTAGLRYDVMSFDYHNYLDASTGARSFEQLTPKLGATFDLLHDKGLYANYSEGFSPPGLTSIFRKRTNATPGNAFYYNLAPARFTNFEIGGWGAFFDNKIYLDAAVYQMLGRNELVSVRQPDNSTDHQSVGKTLHRGIEYSMTYKPDQAWLFRFGGTNAIHSFEDFVLSDSGTDVIKNVNGKEMPQSPHWIANSEVTYKPLYLEGFRISLEWQRIGAWYQDQVNRVQYDDRSFLGLKGVSYLNMRTGYERNGFEVFAKVMNLTNELYANAATRGNRSTDRTTYTPAAPRTFVFGIQYTFTGTTRSTE